MKPWASECPGNRANPGCWRCKDVERRKETKVKAKGENRLLRHILYVLFVSVALPEGGLSRAQSELGRASNPVVAAEEING